ncbi:MAG TPA: DUF1223 domain-containing protein, partial [Steroidobacteraceae bacterium]|nr:DUF1223 domain-containing protein [Steroidobacteraceae bacterium]
MRVMTGLGMGLLLAATVAQSQPPARPTVVELFTSEGCNSCPPAEALIGVLVQRRPDVIALAYHVDYWDYIGWRDRFEIPEATQRQRQYQHSLHLNTVYTPQLVIDGQRDVVGNNDPATVPASTHTQALALDIAVRNEQLNVSLGAGGSGSSVTPAINDVVLVSYLRQGVSKVTRGENAGRELHEYNIVRSVRRLG